MAQEGPLKNFPQITTWRRNLTEDRLTVAVPGLVDPWTRTNENYGSQNPSPLLDTAITLARNGFYAQEPLARAVQPSKRRLASYNGWRENFSWAEAGSKARFPELAEIYAAVARKAAMLSIEVRVPRSSSTSSDSAECQ